MSNYNPYAAPSAEAGLTSAMGAPVRGEPQPWEVGDAIKSAWEVYKGHWAPLTLGYLVVTAIGSVPGYVAPALVATGVLEEKTTQYWAIHAPLTLIGWLIGQYFMAGFTRAALKATRSEQASFGDFFSAGSRYIPYLGSELVKLLGIGLLAAVLVGPGLLLSFEVSRFAGSIAALIGGLVFLIVGIIVSLGLKNAPYYVMDQNLGPIAALRASWDSSRGQKVDLLVLSLAQLGISLLGLAACCLGLFVAVPIVLISQAIVYMKMSGTAPLAAHGREPAYSPGAYGGYGAYGPPGGAGGQGPPGYGP